ncbi:folate receptor gamma-like [Rhodnius prolixus]|uniref:Folate receptor-like domain-containing protein n=1 Tax=Rhodnius prolixus TaxID=13249 RepID=T1HFT3_RHOPR
MLVHSVIVTILFVLLNMISGLPYTDIEKKIEGDIRANDVYEYICLQSTTHKEAPGAEKNLTDECSPWKDNACCTPDTAIKALSFTLYSLNYDMCPQKRMSEQCKKHFIRDTCFYECSPNIGPWKEQIESASRSQRFRHVPLCKSECQDWFNACADDYTCSDNWSKSYDNSLVNNSTNGTHICERDPSERCKPFKDVFETAENFCEKIWDHSWSVVDDSEPCMKLSFDSEKGNPNDLVAKKYAFHQFYLINVSNLSPFIVPNVFLIFCMQKLFI